MEPSPSGDNRQSNDEEEIDPKEEFLTNLQINEKFHQLYLTAFEFYKRTVGSHVNQLPDELNNKEKLLNVFFSFLFPAF